MDFIINGKIKFDRDIFDYKKHIDRGTEISREKLLYQSYYNSLNRSFLVPTWSNFELCTTTVCDAIATPEEKTHLLEHQVNDILKCLKNTEVHADDLAALKKNFTKEHLTHVPITRKTDFLFKKAVNYPRNVAADKAFLSFFGRFRNAVHANFIYYGKDYEYTYEDKGHFVFKNGEVLVWNDKYEGGPELYFDLKTSIKDIWKALVMAIDHKEIIPYPARD